MKNKDTVFPQYRKLANGLTFYKIIDDRNFEEIQFLGSIKNKYKTEAKQYPEILRIQDMLNCLENIYHLSTEKEWLELNSTSI